MPGKRDAPLALSATDRALGLRPLTARSLLASMLLGSHPPRLPVRVLVAAAGLFGISEGAARTALSRMVAAGDLTTAEGSYELGATLAERQRRQDAGQRAEQLAWDRSWRTLFLTAEGRPAAERAATRSRLRDARFGELREGVWTRPANLADDPLQPGDGASDWLMSRTTFDVDPSIHELWPIDDLRRSAVGLDLAVIELTSALEAGDRSVLARGFVVAAAGLRHFRADPLLPTELLPADWPGQDLRRNYDRFDVAYRRVLRDFFRETREPPTPRK